MGNYHYGSEGSCIFFIKKIANADPTHNTLEYFVVLVLA